MRNFKKIILLCVFIFTPIFLAANDNLQIFIEPGAKEQPIINAINNAKKSIDITMYQFTFAEKKIITALIKKAKEHVQIKIILQKAVWPDRCTLRFNRFYNCKSNIYVRRLKKLLEKNNIYVRWGSYKFPYTHQKTIIIDNEKAIIMTLNFSGKAFNKNREYGIIDYNKKDIVDIKKIFYADWQNKNIKIKNKNLIISPINTRKKLNALLNHAKIDLIIETEILGDNKIINKLISLKKKNINIKILVAPIENLQDKETLLRLISQGIAIRTSANPYMHAKMIIVNSNLIDTPSKQTYTYIGSINLLDDSIDKNRELGIIFKINNKNNIYITRKLINIFNKDWDNADHLKVNYESSFSK